MPKMGDAMTEGKVLRWIKHPGDRVAKGEAIAEIETDKVNVEIEAEWEGTLANVLVGEGQVAAVGAPIAVITRPGEADAPEAGTVRAAPASPAASEETTATASPAPGRAPGVSSQAAPSAPATASRAPADAGAVRASPLARRLAEQHGVALATIKGTGPDGRVTKEDVEAAAAAAARSPAGVRAVAPAVREVSLSRMRATIARRMAESKQHAPHFYVTMVVQMDAALALRRQVNEGVPDDQKVSVNDLIVRATALTLLRYPNLNASFAESALRLSEEINISIGVALPEGLIAPTLYHCDRKSLWEIATESKALSERARSGHLRPEDLANGTFTISNLGMFDVDVFTAIINPPQAAILAVGTARPQPVVQNGQVGVATLMQLTLSADHRVTDGAEAARFLGELKRFLESPVWLVASRPA
jgi:pyruvate dehydrogenase E2 component (dihydrolipoamide acetyltransferase)